MYPAIALAQHLNKTAPDVEVWVAGKRGGQEERVAADYGLKFRAVRTAKMPERMLSPAAALFAVRLAAAVASGFAAVGEIKPAAVVGFGGFASFPTVAAAKLRGAPVFLHEQNTLMGLVNRVMSRFADKIFVSFENTEGVEKTKAVFTGNPSRYEGMRLPEKAEARRKLGLDAGRWTLLVFGGSQGALSVNRAVYDWAEMNSGKPDIQILHLTGREKFEEAKKKYGEMLKDGGLKVEVRDYLKEMELAYAAADLSLCRAGATTITEIASVGAPAILCPYPFAAENHQEKNARYMAERGAAMVIPDRELTAASIAEAIGELRNNPEKLRSMGGNARTMYRDGAARKMAETLTARIGN